uniref:Uncharacterized protein n=1 Tax=Siphoviridae sp. ctGuJ10 TaxID=2825418 RepID=A0A8S5PTF4_9CAUD|nr:MAG TPA: hypothetical protein [Siphoviridae sp. ctGuJ10]
MLSKYFSNLTISLTIIGLVLSAPPLPYTYIIYVIRI